MIEPWYDEETQQHYKLAPYENGIGLFSCNADGSAGYHHRPIRGEDMYGEFLCDKLDDRWSTEQILARRVMAMSATTEDSEQSVSRRIIRENADFDWHAEGDVWGSI